MDSHRSHNFNFLNFEEDYDFKKPLQRQDKMFRKNHVLPGINNPTNNAQSMNELKQPNEKPNVKEIRFDKSKEVMAKMRQSAPSLINDLSSVIGKIA